MVIIPETLFMFPVKLPEFVRDNDITTIFWVPTVMINVANSGVLSEIELPKLKNVVFCGEVMPNTQLNIWQQSPAARHIRKPLRSDGNFGRMYLLYCRQTFQGQ